MLVLRRNARQEVRLALAQSQREVAGILQRTGSLVSVLFADKVDEQRLSAECASLRASIATCRDQLVGLHAGAR